MRDEELDRKQVEAFSRLTPEQASNVDDDFLPLALRHALEQIPPEELARRVAERDERNLGG